MISTIRKLYQNESIFKRLAAIFLIDSACLGFLLLITSVINLMEDKGWGMVFGIIIFPLSVIGIIVINAVMLFFVARTTSQRAIAVTIAVGIFYYLMVVLKVKF